MDGGHGCTMCMYLLLLSYVLKMVRMVNFIICIFYYTQKYMLSLKLSEHRRAGQLTRDMASSCLSCPLLKVT